MKFAQIGRALSRLIYENLRAYRMACGKYEGRRLVCLLDEYLMWLEEQGFPMGRLGELMFFIYELKIAGAEGVFGRVRLSERAAR